MSKPTPIPARSLDTALAHVRADGRLVVATVYRVWYIDARTLAKFEHAGVWLLKEEGDGYRIADRQIVSLPAAWAALR